MGRYIDGFVIPVAKDRIEDYRRVAEKASLIWKEYGALDYWECVGDDVPYGKRTSFPRSVKVKPGETVVFSWIMYRNRAARDRINAKVMKDPRLAGMMNAKDHPFDPKRMIYGGFKSLVHL